jgi:hypothetical protein
MSAYDRSGLLAVIVVMLRMRGLMEVLMPRNVSVQSNSTPMAHLLAFALGATAVGALAVGALAIGRVAIDRVAIRRARFAKLEVDELTVRKLHVVENSGSMR